MNKKVVVLVLLAATCWASVAAFVRMLTQFGFTAIQITVLKMVFGFLTVFVFLLITDKKAFQIKLKDLPWFVMNGIGCILLYNICYIKTIQFSNIATAAVLLYTAPVFVMLLSILIFRERFTIKKGICLVLAFSGCALVSGFGSREMSISKEVLFFGLMAGVGYALYSIISRVLLKSYEALTIVFYTLLFTAGACVLITNPVTLVDTMLLNPSTIVVGILAGIITGAVPYILFTSGLKYIEASKAAMIASIEPVLAAFLGFLFYQEGMNVQQLLGICCIVATIIILELHISEKAVA